MAKTPLNLLLPLCSSFAKSSLTLGDLLAGYTNPPSGGFSDRCSTCPHRQLGDGLFGLGAAPYTPPSWSYCKRRFQRFLVNIEPTPNQHEDVSTKANGIAECLNRKFLGRTATKWPHSYSGWIMG